VAQLCEAWEGERGRFQTARQKALLYG
jgi:hypothetical protein